jgi:hypothetical protein
VVLVLVVLMVMVALAATYAVQRHRKRQGGVIAVERPTGPQGRAG